MSEDINGPWLTVKISTSVATTTSNPFSECLRIAQRSVKSVVTLIKRLRETGKLASIHHPLSLTALTTQTFTSPEELAHRKLQEALRKERLRRRQPGSALNMEHPEGLSSCNDSDLRGDADEEQIGCVRDGSHELHPWYASGLESQGDQESGEVVEPEVVSEGKVSEGSHLLTRRATGTSSRDLRGGPGLLPDRELQDLARLIAKASGTPPSRPQTLNADGHSIAGSTQPEDQTDADVRIPPRADKLLELLLKSQVG